VGGRRPPGSWPQVSARLPVLIGCAGGYEAGPVRHDDRRSGNPPAVQALVYIAAFAPR
jgi:hypothetical protein